MNERNHCYVLCVKGYLGLIIKLCEVAAPFPCTSVSCDLPVFPQTRVNRFLLCMGGIASFLPLKLRQQLQLESFTVRLGCSSPREHVLSFLSLAVWTCSTILCWKTYRFGFDKLCMSQHCACTYRLIVPGEFSRMP